MGYYATGSGDVTVKGTMAEEFKKFISNPSDELLYVLQYIDVDIYKDSAYISEDDSHWHEENIQMFLNAIIPYISAGNLEYSSEDECRWRYVFNPETNEWDEQSGSIYYTEKDMVETLEKLGYCCVKQELPKQALAS